MYIVTKGHSCSPRPQKTVHNFRLEQPSMYFPLPFSYNYHYFESVKFQSIVSLLSYSIIMY